MDNPSPSQNIIVNLPVNITYTAIENILREKIVGEIIKTEDDNGKISRYAQILDISIDSSEDTNYDLVLDVRFQTLTSLFKNKEGKILLYLSISFVESTQEIYVADFKLKGNTGSWLMNNSLEAMANTLLRGKLMKKMQFDFKPLIDEKILELNKKMDEPYEVYKGINLFGKIENFSVKKILPKPLNVLVLVKVTANAVVDVEEISFEDSAPDEIPGVV